MRRYGHKFQHVLCLFHRNLKRPQLFFFILFSYVFYRLENCAILFKSSTWIEKQHASGKVASIWFYSALNCHDFDQLSLDGLWLKPCGNFREWFSSLHSFRAPIAPCTEINKPNFIWKNINFANFASWKIIERNSRWIAAAEIHLDDSAHLLFTVEFFTFCSSVGIVQPFSHLLHPSLTLLTCSTIPNTEICHHLRKFELYVSERPSSASLLCDTTL